MKLTNDNSAFKSVTVRTHSKGKAYAASVKGFANKLEGIRLKVHEPKTDKTYYFVIPYAAYKGRRATTSLEISFHLDGSPNRKQSNSYEVPNWWAYEVPHWGKMVTHEIDNNSLAPKNTTFERLYTFKDE